MFRKLLISFALGLTVLPVACNLDLLPNDPAPGDGTIDDPASGELPIRARVRNESDQRVDVTVRFVSEDEPVRLAFLRVPAETVTTIAGPRSQSIELSGVTEGGVALSSARLVFGVDFDELRTAEYIVRSIQDPPDDEPPRPAPPALTISQVSKDAVVLGETLTIDWSDSGSSSAVVSLYLRPADDEAAPLVPLSPAIGAALDGLNDSFVAVVEGVGPGDYEIVGRIDDGDQSVLAVAPGTVRVSRDPANTAPTISLIGPAEVIVLRNGDSLTITWTDVDPDDNATVVFALAPAQTDVIAIEETVISPPIAENSDKQPADSVTLTLGGLLPGLYDLTARIDDGRLEGTDRLSSVIRIVPTTTAPNAFPTLNLIKPDANFEVTKGDSFVVKWTDSDDNDNARISLLLDRDSQTSLLNGNEILLAASIDEDPDGAADQVSVVVPLDTPIGLYRLVSVIGDGLTQVVTRAPALITVRGTTGGGGGGGGDGVDGGSTQITLVPSAQIVQHPGETVVVVITHEVGPVPRRAQLFLSNQAYGGNFFINITPTAGTAPSTKTYSIVIDTGLVPNSVWPRSFDILLETNVDGIITTTRSVRPLWILQEIEILGLRSINYICEQGDRLDSEPTDFVGIEWTWYGGGFGNGDSSSVAFWLSADGVVPANGADDSSHQLLALVPGSPNLTHADRIPLDEVRGALSLGAAGETSLGLNEDWYWLIAVFNPGTENRVLPVFSRPVRVCDPIEAFSGP